MSAFLERLVGQVVPGGCVDCDVEQEVFRDNQLVGVYRFEVRHDDTCPTLRRMRRRGRVR